MSQQLTELVSEGVTSYPLGDELIVFSESCQRLFRFNATAAFIWRGCEQRLARHAIADEIAHAYRVPLGRARDDVESALTDWKHAGLLVTANRRATASPRAQDKTRFEPRGHAGSGTAEGRAIQRVYRLLDTTVEIRFACLEAERLAHPAIAHLEVAARDSLDRRLDVVPSGCGYRVLREGVLVSRCSSASELTPFLHSHLLMTAYRNTNYLMAIHAAAVSRDDVCIVLPAPSGGGKSTLTAALVRSGLDYLTDEVVLLGGESGRIYALPVSLSLKQPVWTPLEALYPDLTKLPIHRRKDGKTVRYLPPPDGATARSERGSRTRAIVFPSYGEDEPASSLVALSSAEALQRVTIAGYDVAGGRLDARLVGAVVDWIRDLECYELRYHAWSEAVRRMKELLA